MSLPDEAVPEEALCRPPREAWPLARVLGLVLMKMGRAEPPFEPRRRPQAGKSGDPRSQNADSSPRAQGAPVLGRAERRKGKGEAPRALTAYGLGRRVAVDWTWAPPLPHDASMIARIGQVPACKSCHDYLRSWRPAVGLRRLYVRQRACPSDPSLLASSPASVLAPFRWNGANSPVLCGGEGKTSTRGARSSPAEEATCSPQPR